MNVNKININQSEQSYYIASDIYDVSAHNNDTAFSSLSELLNSENLSTLIPIAVRCGGMTIRFIQSSDNKYAQYRLMSDEFTKDITQWAIVEEGVYTENPEFVYVKTDKEGKILLAIKVDGSIYYGAGCPQQIIDYIEEKLGDFSLDEYEDIVAFLNDLEKSDKTLRDLLNEKVDKVEGNSLIDAEYAKGVNYIENQEFIEVELDIDDKILGGRKVNGNKFENNDVELNGNATVGGSLEVDGVIIKNIEDHENRSEITLDTEKKIISYRKDDGTKVENVGIETNHLELTLQGMTDFQLALKSSGFRPGGGGNWSDRDIIELPEPESYALLNLIIINLPMRDEDVSEGVAEYYDKSGNYFKMDCSLEIQGQTSSIFAITSGKGNYTLDLAKEVKFGNWVPQDSFHLKGCAKDVTRAILPTSYKLAWKLMNYLNAKPNRAIVDESNISTTSATGNRMNDWPTDARCLPDGFPVEIYINGEYWGLYSWLLKKHRKNYSMDKNDYTSMFIDADNLMVDDNTYDEQSFWVSGPERWWTFFDIKGPKNLICMDGSEFDGDNPKELIDNTSDVYDDSNKKHKGSAITKTIIKSWSDKYLEVKELINNNNMVSAKAKFNENFDLNACIFVFIYNVVMNNADSIRKNTLWGTYSNGKVIPMLWDLDGMYGTGWLGYSANAPSVNTFNKYIVASWPLNLLWTLYETEIKAYYHELRDNKIIDISVWDAVINGWINRVGEDAYKRDIEKWPETPSYRSNLTNTEYWRQDGYVNASSSHHLWDNSTTYNVGDVTYLKLYPSYNGAYMKYTAIKQSDSLNPQCPVSDYYNEFPQVGGYFDSPKRMRKWMVTQISLVDNLMDYNN